MRAGMQLDALAGAFDVRLVVLPVAGGGRDTEWAAERAGTVDVLEPAAHEHRAGLVALVRQAEWRQRLAACEPLPHAATVAGPALAGTILDRLALPAPAPVHALRAYLAPLGVAVAEASDAPKLTVDLDDDDETLLRSGGAEEEADAYARLLECFGPTFAWASLASAFDAAAVASRRPVRTVVVPNAIGIVHAPRRRREADGAVRLLFVGNLTYGPNAEAARMLAGDVLPRVRARVSQDVRVEIVGDFAATGPVADLAAIEGVELLGHVPELAALYARADVVVVPLLHASGTRIKILEAFAHEVPVVSTTAGASGLDAVDGRDLLIGDDADEIAEAVARLLTEPEQAADLARSARHLVQTTYAPDIVGRRLVELIREAR